MSADNPAEYIARLEGQLRQERAARAVAEQEVAQLRVELSASSDIRAALVTAGADAAGTIVTALRRLQEYQAIVDAAVEWYQAPLAAFPQAIHRLNLVIKTHLKRVESQS